MKKKLKSNLIVLFLISALYILYSTLVIKPFNFNNFSLVDDGQVLLQSSSFLIDCLNGEACIKFLDQTFEFGTSRFRPSYWLLSNFNYGVFGLNATNYHLFRVYVVGYLTILLFAIILLKQKVNWPTVVIMTMVFFTSISFSENIIRLGTNEPYQILFIEIFYLL